MLFGASAPGQYDGRTPHHRQTPLNNLQHLPVNSDAPKARIHWAVAMNHRNRTGGFGMLCLLLGLHMLRQDHGPLVWLALVLQFLVYPQLVFQWARRARDQLGAEIHAMQFDALCFGAWLVVLHFPLWIGFVLFTSSSQNLTLFRGLRGFVQALVLLALGCALAGLAIGWTVQPQTDPWVSAVAIVTISVYLTVVSLAGQTRAMRLHETKRQLRANELVLQQELAKNQSLQAELREQARRDALTGLFNRHHLNDIMERELARCARDGQPMSLLLIDVDHFKHINDTYGHQVGDEVLRATARLLSERTRASDMLFRYGGEEFLLVLSQADSAAAKEMAEELRLLYAASPLSPGNPAVLATLSIGVATFADHGVTFDHLLQAADQAMYRAKHAGRNRVEIA